MPAIARGIAACRAVPGRFERVDRGQPFLVIVDYAHTDDALRNVIQIARELATAGPGDHAFRLRRRPRPFQASLMGMAAAELSDYVVLTSDNPRSEDPLGIMNDALVGLRRFDTPHAVEPDRARAIRIAIEQAQPRATWCCWRARATRPIRFSKTGRIHFDDRETAREALRSLGYKR